MRKLFAMLLTVVVILSLSVTVFAAQQGGTITVTNAKLGETYNLYKIFDLSYDATTKAFTYTVPEGSAWENFITGTEGEKYFTYNSTNRTVDPKQALYDNPAAFAQAAIAFAKNAANNVQPSATKTAPKTNESDQTATTVPLSFEGLDMGYYLLDTSVGTAVALESNNTAVTVTDKSATPRIQKQVYEDDNPGAGWGAENTAAVRQTVEYRIQITNVQGLNMVDMIDTMSNGLTFDPNSLTVVVRHKDNTEQKVEGETNPGVVGSNGTWYLVYGEQGSPDHGTEHLGNSTFHIHFRNKWISTLAADDIIEVSYKADLNENAIVGDPGNPNEVYLKYGNNQQTVSSTVKTYTWSFAIYKYTKSGDDQNIPLDGAKFIVIKDRGTSQAGYATEIDKHGKIINWSWDEADAYPFVSGTDGMINFSGLDADTYLIREVEAPEGYNKITTDYIITVSQEGVVRYNNKDVTRLEVLNQAGTELPSTGGFGTTLFITTGMLGVMFFGVLMVTNKRMKKEGY